MSPMLFSLFIEDLELFIQDSPTSGLTIDDITFILLLFADDMVLFGKSPDELQHSLDLLETYCDSWGLEVNINKTKLWYVENLDKYTIMRNGHSKANCQRQSMILISQAPYLTIMDILLLTKNPWQTKD